MKKRFVILFLAVVMFLQLAPTSHMSANDAFTYDDAHITMRTENKPMEENTEGSTEHVHRLHVMVQVDGQKQEEKVLTYAEDADPAQTEITAKEGFEIESITLDGQAFQNSITFDKEQATDKTLMIQLVSKTNLTIHYVDEKGNSIAKDERKSGKRNSVLSLTDKAIAGYTADKGNPKEVTLSQAENEITLHYVKLEAATKDVQETPYYFTFAKDSSNVELYYSTDGKTLAKMNIGERLQVNGGIVSFFVKVPEGYTPGTTFQHRNAQFEENLSSKKYGNGVYTNIGDNYLQTFETAQREAEKLGCIKEFHYSYRKPIYYHREFKIVAVPAEVKVAYDLNGGKTDTKIEDKNTYYHPVVLKEPSTITVSDQKPVKAGYTFTGWVLDVNGKTYAPKAELSIRDIWDEIKKGDKKVTITFKANYTANTDTPYQVAYYYEDRPGHYPEAPMSLEQRKGTTDMTVKLSEKELTPTKEQYVLDPSANHVVDGIVRADGNLVLKVYFAIDQIGAEDGSDNIPDKFEAKVSYDAEHGSTSFSHTYVVLKDKDGKYSETGSGFLTEEQIPEVSAEAGYHFTDWSPQTPEKGMEITSEGKHFTAQHARNMYTATIHYMDEDTGKEIAEAKILQNVKHGSVVNGLEYKKDIENYAFTSAETVRIEKDGMVVNVNYSVDTKGGKDNPDHSADGIPDKYQVRFSYTAKDHGRITGTVVEYVTRPGNDVNAPVSPQAAVEALADDGYHFVKWTSEKGTYLNVDDIRKAQFMEDTQLIAEFESMPAPILPDTPQEPTVPSEPTVPAEPIQPTQPANPVVTAPVGNIATPAVQLPFTTPTPQAPITVTRTPNPVQAPVQKVEREEDNKTPKAEEKTEVVKNEQTPKGIIEGNWALINLLCAAGSVLLGLILLLSKVKKEEHEEQKQDASFTYEEDAAQTYRRRKWLRVVSTITAILSVIVFLLTEDMSLPMILVDKWTLFMAALLIIQLLFVFFGRRWKENDKDEEETIQAAHS